jgi:hypothetical protein
LTALFFHANVHFVNTSAKFELHSLFLLDDISNNRDLTLRDLFRSGSVFGLVNSILKVLISKGYITASGMPGRAPSLTSR